MKKRSKKNKKSSNNRNLDIFIRYILLLILALFSLPVIYKIFTPLTIDVSAYLLGLIYDINSSKDLILINSKTLIQIIPACVAGSAYLLLLILNLTLPLSLEKRIKSILLSFALLFLLNILRIFFLAILYHNDYPYVDFTHKLFWYVLSTLFVILIWFLVVRIFKIKEIPVYTDFKYLSKNIAR